MRFIMAAADRLLAAIVPNTTAAAWSCPVGSVRSTCYCLCPSQSGTHYWYDKCVSTLTGGVTKGCTKTVYTCTCPG
jgi:hypothetical protein